MDGLLSMSGLTSNLGPAELRALGYSSLNAQLSETNKTKLVAISPQALKDCMSKLHNDKLYHDHGPGIYFFLEM